MSVPSCFNSFVSSSHHHVIDAMNLRHPLIWQRPLTWSTLRRNVLLTINWRTAAVFLVLIPALCFAPLYISYVPKRWLHSLAIVMKTDAMMYPFIAILVYCWMILPMNVAANIKKELEVAGYRQVTHIGGSLVQGICLLPVWALLFNRVRNEVSGATIALLICYGAPIFHLGSIWHSMSRIEDYSGEEQEEMDLRSLTPMPQPTETPCPSPPLTVADVKRNVVYTFCTLRPLAVVLFGIVFPLLYATMKYSSLTEDNAREILGTPAFIALCSWCILLTTFSGISVAGFAVELQRSGYVESYGVRGAIIHCAFLAPVFWMHATSFRDRMPWYVSALTADYGLGVLLFGRTWFSAWTLSADPIKMDEKSRSMEDAGSLDRKEPVALVS